MTPVESARGKQKITPHLWYDKEAKEAAEFYVATFGGDSRVMNVSQIKDTPSGDCDIVDFELVRYRFMAISAGPYFKFTPAISISVQCESEREIDRIYGTLIDGGQALMALSNYGFSKKYGWVADKYGLSWQLNLPQEYSNVAHKIAPFFLFVGTRAGKAEEAMRMYTSVFPESKMGEIHRHSGGDGEKEGTVQHASFELCGQEFMAMDSSLEAHTFDFNEAVSLIVSCEDQKEIDYYWEKLSAVPESEQCGWLKDRFGVSWQIVPRAMDEMMGRGTPEQKARLTRAFLQMKKLDIASLRAAFDAGA